LRGFTAFSEGEYQLASGISTSGADALWSCIRARLEPCRNGQGMNLGFNPCGASPFTTAIAFDPIQQRAEIGNSPEQD
jgi:hypothetical protein